MYIPNWWGISDGSGIWASKLVNTLVATKRWWRGDVVKITIVTPWISSTKSGGQALGFFLRFFDKKFSFPIKAYIYFVYRFDIFVAAPSCTSIMLNVWCLWSVWHPATMRQVHDDNLNKVANEFSLKAGESCVRSCRPSLFIMAFTPLKTNMAMENHHFSSEIRLQIVVFPLFVSFRGCIFSSRSAEHQ